MRKADRRQGFGEASVGFRGAVETPLALSFIGKGAAIDVDRVAGSLGVSKTQLAETIGVGRETLYKRARSEAPKTQARLREMLEILGRVLEWAGGKEQAMAWYRAQPIPAFGGRTPESLVKSGQATALRDYLDHLALGGYA
ncbi:MAG: antitoxin Xre/MbcA/ParS toxin-binding domain-containing protein [Propylenella sp.]